MKSGVEEKNEEQVISTALGEDNSDHEEEERVKLLYQLSLMPKLKTAFSTCMSWLKQQHEHEATPMNLMLLRNLQTLTTSKKFGSFKQKSITDYFKPA